MYWAGRKTNLIILLAWQTQRRSRTHVVVISALRFFVVRARSDATSADTPFLGRRNPLICDLTETTNWQSLTQISLRSVNHRSRPVQRRWWLLLDLQTCCLLWKLRWWLLNMTECAHHIRITLRSLKIKGCPPLLLLINRVCGEHTSKIVIWDVLLMITCVSLTPPNHSEKMILLSLVVICLGSQSWCISILCCKRI